MKVIIIGVIVVAKFAIPVLIVRFPFAAGWANFVLDTVDGDLLIPLGLEDGPYQLIDKAADWCTYVGMVFVAREWTIKTHHRCAVRLPHRWSVAVLHHRRGDHLLLPQLP